MPGRDMLSGSCMVGLAIVKLARSHHLRAPLHRTKSRLDELVLLGLENAIPRGHGPSVARNVQHGMSDCLGPGCRTKGLHIGPRASAD